MKKIVSLLLTAMLLLSMTACGGNSEPPAGTDSQKGTAGKTENATTEAQPQDTVPEDWGVDGEIVARKNKVSTKVCFQWPHYYGNSANTGEAARQEDGTLVLVDRYKSGISPEDVALKNTYPAYKEQIENALADFMGNRYKDGAVTLGDGEMCTIGEYEVCKYSGKHTYTYNENAAEHQVVLYATEIKENGAIIYWLVEDVTEDQSAGQLIRDHAQKIIQSIKEK